ncbi:hypothetical protein FLX56_23255 [Synechococcus moorigangaii CMS01]|nr:hypothetical protein [Synechococcus moorigangaii CMS01]
MYCPSPTSPIIHRLAQSLWENPPSDRRYLVGCGYHAQEEIILAQLLGDRLDKQIWQQQFVQGKAVYHSAVALADLWEQPQTQGLLCLWLAPGAKDLSAILTWVGEAIAAAGITQAQIQAVLVFGLTTVIPRETPLLFQGDRLGVPLILFCPGAIYREMCEQTPEATDLGQILWSPEEIQMFWRRTEQEYFQTLIAAGPCAFPENERLTLQPGQWGYQDLMSAATELGETGGLLPFIRGREAHQKREFAEAQAAYEASLCHYGQAEGIDWLKVLRDNPNSPLLNQLASPQAERLALVLFHLGLLLGDRPQTLSQPNPTGEQALQYLRFSLRLWEQQQQWAWVSGLGLMIGIFLEQWQRWPALDDLGWSLLKPAPDNWDLLLIGQNYGCMAAIAVHQRQWHKAQTLTQTALEYFHTAEIKPPLGAVPWLALLLARSLQALGQPQKAIATLEEILPIIRKTLGQPTPWGHWQRQLYQNIFQILSLLYRQIKDYRQAFDLTWELQQYEQQWGWHPFVGTQPLPVPQQSHGTDLGAICLTASGRQADIQALLTRLRQPENHLVLLHGAAAVGKTSLLRTGLIPALQHTTFGDRPGRVIYLKTYGQWARRLVQAIHGDRPFCPRLPSPSLDPLLHLQQDQDSSPMTVLIFDQFERFFQQYPQPAERQGFLNFLAKSLQLPTVKVILVCRNEALAPLLDWEMGADFGPAHRNIFDPRIRHRLGNLSETATKDLLTQVATWANLPLEAALIERLTQDLQDNQGEIRPQSLQVISAQLHRDQLYTLGKYLGLGFPPRLSLLERSLMAVIRLCGDENRDLAWQFLHYFTDLRHSQLVLTKADILQLGRQVLGDRRLGEEKAELILHIFKTTGLIRYQLYAGQESYQLARADLVEPIRHHYQTFQSQQWLRRLTGREQHWPWRRWWQFSVGTMWRLGLGAIALGFGLRWVELQRYQRWQEVQNAHLGKLAEAANVLQAGAQPTEALRESIQAAVQLQNLDRKDDEVITPGTRLKVILTLEQSLAAQTTPWETVQEFGQNFVPGMFRPPGDRQRISPDAPITDFSFIGQSFQLLTAHPNQPLQQWPDQEDGAEILRIDQPSISRLAPQPRGNLWATADADALVTLRQTDGHLVQTLGRFQEDITSLAWSQDGKILAVGSRDQTIRIWAATGELLQILTEHQGPITALQFSPDGKLLATAAGDRTVQIWQRRRNNSFFLVTQFPPFATEMIDLQFSADSRYLGLTGQNHQGVVLPMTYKNNNPRFGEPVPINHQGNGESRVIFYDNLPLLVTNTDHQQLQFWQLDGTFLGSLGGHQAPIQALRWHPQRKAIATLDQNNQLILWNLDLDALVQKSCRLLVYGNLPRAGNQSQSDRQRCAAPLNLPPE